MLISPNRRCKIADIYYSNWISNAVCLGGEGKDHICFRAIDTDQDGRVTFEEFKAILGDDKEKFNAADANQDGTISHDEYHQSIGHGSS